MNSDKPTSEWLAQLCDRRARLQSDIEAMKGVLLAIFCVPIFLLISACCHTAPPIKEKTQVVQAKSDPNKENVAPLNRDLPAVAYSKDGVLWRWSVKRQGWE